MKRAEILDTAKQYVTKDRDATHGDMEDNFDSIAELWQIYFNNWVDACGYMACGGELAIKKGKDDGTDRT
jgi:hypothetical protein